MEAEEESGGRTAEAGANEEDVQELPNGEVEGMKELNIDEDSTPGGTSSFAVEAFMASQFAAMATPRGASKMAAPVGPGKSKQLENFRQALSNLEKMLKSDKTDDQLEGTKKFRQLLSMNEREPIVPFQDMLDQNIVPHLLRFLKKNELVTLQVEALWALTNIAAGTSEHTQLLIKNNVVPTLVGLLDSKHQDVLQQAVWVLGNIAGDGTSARDTVLLAGVLEPLLKCMQENKRTGLLRIATWTLSNLCDGQPRPVFKVGAVLRTIKEVLQSEDTEILSHACWALSHLCDGPSPHIQAVVKAKVCPRLVELLHCKTWRVVKPALRTVGNIVCAEDDQDFTQHIIECGAVPCLRTLIQHHNREIQKEACWTLSNIAAGTVDQIQCVLDSGSIPTLVELASKGANTDPDVKIEACWVLLNATSCGSEQQIERLVKAGCVSVLCNLLHDHNMVMMALEGLEKILQVGETLALQLDEPGNNVHASLLDTKKFEALQKNRNAAVAKRSAKIWKNYFVVCAICNSAFPKNSTSTKFCAECKCNVCTACDCSVYHLSYQDALWGELADNESKGDKNRHQPKKGKRKKKKGKEKKRKDTLKPSAASNVNTNEQGMTKEEDGALVQADSSSEGESADEQPQPASLEAQDLTAHADTPNATSKQRRKLANANLSVDEQQGRKEALPVDNTLDDVLADPERDPEGDLDYVEFLNSNGSILDLWKLINENENTKTEDSPMSFSTVRQ